MRWSSIAVCPEQRWQHRRWREKVVRVVSHDSDGVLIEDERDLVRHRVSEKTLRNKYNYLNVSSP